VVTSANNAERRPDHLEELVSTVALAGTVSTTIAVPPGCYIERVLTRTVVAVTGGYHVGVAGAEKRYGQNIGGNPGDTNLTYARTPPPTQTGNDSVTIMLTSANPGGTFSDGSGRIRVTIFFVRFTAALS
jgi:hypothetical protein